MTDREEAARKAANLLGDIVNTFGFEREVMPVFLEELRRQHRTLQQGIMTMFIHAILDMADRYEKGHFDMRNEWSCSVALKIRQAMVEQQLLIVTGEGEQREYRYYSPCI